MSGERKLGQYDTLKAAAAARKAAEEKVFRAADRGGAR